MEHEADHSVCWRDYGECRYNLAVLSPDLKCLGEHLPAVAAVELTAQQVTAGWRVPECDSACVQGQPCVWVALAMRGERRLDTGKSHEVKEDRMFKSVWPGENITTDDCNFQFVQL
jgi:hypothetical protein